MVISKKKNYGMVIFSDASVGSRPRAIPKYKENQHQQSVGAMVKWTQSGPPSLWLTRRYQLEDQAR